MQPIVAQAFALGATMDRSATPLLHTMTSTLRFALRALLCTLGAVAAFAHAAPPLSDDRKQALEEFIVAYRLADAWPQMAPKIAHDSLPRLEDATHADLDADKFADRAQADAAHARVPALLAQGRRDLEEALQHFDADEFAAYTAYEIYAKYFETAEIRQISAFFDSPTGRKVSTLAPTILVESRRPGAGDVMAQHFDAAELAEITAFWTSPVGLKMSATAEQIREDMHAHFIERSEPSVQAVARRLATQAEAGADTASK
jgi:hypothetical protein